SIPYKWWWGYSSEDKHQEITDGNGNDVGGSIAGVNGLGINEDEWVSEVLPEVRTAPDNWVVNLPPGTYWLTFEIDSPNENDEGSNEGNNTRSESFVVVEPPKPDLQGSGGYQDKDYYPGDTVVFDFVVLNDGQASAKSGLVYYYAHKDSESYSSADKLDDESDSYGDLGPGDTSRQRFWWHIPTDAPAGMYYVSFWIDATNTTPNEIDEEENNKGYWSVEVKERPGPDRRYKIIYPGIGDRNNISWFIQISDIHIGKNASAVSNLEWVRDTAHPTIDPDFIVATGDLTESEP
ncbi:unnamed protein product, partial [marine sediment metagenome]